MFGRHRTNDNRPMAPLASPGWALCLLLAIACGDARAASDWPWWRGPARDGVAEADPFPPLQWDADENVAWRVHVPGRGHSSPTVVGERIFLTTADEHSQVRSVLCYRATNGQLEWQTPIHQGPLDPKCNPKNSHASSTVACDGVRIFASFWHAGAIWATALDLQGKQVWQRRVEEFVSHHGYSASPAIYEDYLIVAADHKGESGGAIVALNREDGRVAWRQRRPSAPSYVSPIMLHVAGRDQLLLAGCQRVSSYDPATGQPLWEVAGTTTECVGTAAAAGDLVFASGGYPDFETICVRGDGSAETVWRNDVRVYVPSLIVYEDHVYAVTDPGIVYCWSATSGETRWKRRLEGDFSASPILVGDRIYACSEQGTTFVFRASHVDFELLAKNQLGDEQMATPTLCGGRVFLRVAEQLDGRRQESLCCIRE